MTEHLALPETVLRAKRAQAAWGGLSVRDRCDRLGRMRSTLLEDLEGISDRLCRELGKPAFETLSMDIGPLLEAVLSNCARAPSVLAERDLPIRLLKHRRSTQRYTPRGIVAILAPYNFPLAIAGSEMVMALLAGNAVIIKASELAPMSTLWLKHAVEATGIDPDLVQVVTGGPDAGMALIKTGVDYVSFTGSTDAGRQVAMACAERLIPFRVELGGKASAIVTEDVDPDRVASALCWGAFAGTGQVCAGVQRAFIHSSRFEDVRRRLFDEVAELRSSGTGFDHDLGPVAPPAARRTRELLCDAQDRGAVFDIGTVPMEGQVQIAPVVLRDVPLGAPVLEEECFGPVLCLVEVGSDEEALSRANASRYGLAGYVFCRDRARARRIAERMQCGTVMINDVVYSYGLTETPWNGLKQSGLNPTHGDEGLRDYCQLRHINQERVPAQLAREPWWFPYNSLRANVLKRGLFALYGRGLKERVLGALRPEEPR